MPIKNDPQTGRILPGSGGRAPGSRNKLSADFIKALQEDFAENGIEAVRIVRMEEPAQYLKIIAMIVPKELQITEGVYDGLSDAQLAIIIDAAKRAFGADQEDGSREGQALN